VVLNSPIMLSAAGLTVQMDSGVFESSTGSR